MSVHRGKMKELRAQTSLHFYFKKISTPGVEVHAFNHGAPGAEEGGSLWVLGLPSLQGEC